MIIKELIFKIDNFFVQQRKWLGAKSSVAILLIPLSLFGVLHFGLRALLVLASSMLFCMLFGILGSLIQNKTYRLFNSGSIVTGLLLGLTLTASTPMYMIVIGALVAEFLGKKVLINYKRGAFFNPAVLGRTAVAILETFDPNMSYSSNVDIVLGASVLAKDNGGHIRPLLFDAFFGFTKGSIGEVNAFLLLIVAVLLFRYIIIKREAAIAMIVSTPLWVLALPVTVEIVGHAPWVANPLYFMFGGGTLLTAIFFATDPVTIPNNRFGGIIFGIVCGVIAVAGKFYTSIPGIEMYGILLMNAFTPFLNKLSWKSGQGKAIPENNSHSSTKVTTETVDGECRSFDLYFAGGPFRMLKYSNVEDRVRESNLTGCGGGHFPVYRKWSAFKKQSGTRYLVINALEGEPEAFKDFYLISNYVEIFVEGMLIVAKTFGIKEVVIVLNPQYQQCFARINYALVGIEKLLKQELINVNLKFGPSPDRYVCGEETALIHYLNTGGTESQLKPPYPFEVGYKGCPTLIHNVETVSWIPLILANQALFKEGKTRKLMSVSINEKKIGVYEIDSDCSVSDLLIKSGFLLDEISSIRMGGSAGGFVFPEEFETKINLKDLSKINVSLGSGAVRIVQRENELFQELLMSAKFFRDESCGRCLPCRQGTKEFLNILTKMERETITQIEYAKLIDIAQTMKLTSTCGLGRSAPFPLISLLQKRPDAILGLVAREDKDD